MAAGRGWAMAPDRPVMVVALGSCQAGFSRGWPLDANGVALRARAACLPSASLSWTAAKRSHASHSRANVSLGLRRRRFIPFRQSCKAERLASSPLAGGAQRLVNATVSDIPSLSRCCRGNQAWGHWRQRMGRRTVQPHSSQTLALWPSGPMANRSSHSRHSWQWASRLHRTRASLTQQRLTQQRRVWNPEVV
jgi:hypothetical protein